LNFATDGGDYHISIDRIKEGKFSASDVRLRFEMADQNPAEVQEACFTWHTVIHSGNQAGNTSSATMAESENLIGLKTEQMSLTIPGKPDVENNL
jgi:hypothetical protein